MRNMLQAPFICSKGKGRLWFSLAHDFQDEKIFLRINFLLKACSKSMNKCIELEEQFYGMRFINNQRTDAAGILMEKIMSIDTSKGHPAMDYKQHETTYASFLALVKWTVILCIGILVGMLVFLV